eukprot:gene5072-3658_t
MTALLRSKNRVVPQLLIAGEELCDLRINAQNPDLFFSIPLLEPSRITIQFQEFNSASRCLLLLSPCDPYPTNETAVWRLSSPDPQKNVIIHPADSNYPTSTLYLCIRYLELSGHTFIRLKVTLEHTFFAAWFRRDRCECLPSKKASIMAAAAAAATASGGSTLTRLSERRESDTGLRSGPLPGAPLSWHDEEEDREAQAMYQDSKTMHRLEYGAGAESSSSNEIVMEDVVDDSRDTFHQTPHLFTRSSLYCGEWRGNLPHGRGIKLYAVSAVGQVVLEKMYNSAMLVRAVYEQRTIPWTANSLQESFEGTITNGGTLSSLNLDEVKGWNVIPLIERGMEAYDGYWCNGEKEGTGIYQWQDRSYIGEWAAGMREGTGVLEKQDGSWYRGEWHFDHRHGTGTSYDVHTETTYTGKWANGLRNGSGRLVYKNGITVIGEWREDIVHDQVQATFPDGSRYDGGWLNDCRSGHGVWTDPRECVYTNTWVGDRREGPGSIRFTNGVMFHGTWKNDEVVDGAYHFANGDVYTGAWCERTLTREGFGKCVSKNGDIYEGEWHQDLRHGQGKMVYADNKATYEGTWVENVRHGHGVLHDVHGVYDGEFVQDERCGHGIQTGPDGSHYEGGWKHDYRAGAGVYFYAPDNTTYEGIFLHDRLQGEGTSEVISTKDFYEGTWLDGVKQGRGTRVFPNGDILRGIWHKGQHQNGRIEYVYADGTKFVGDWCDGQRQGKGTQVNTDGTVYEGEWMNNQPNGHGVLTQTDGSSVECQWENGRQLDGGGVLTFADGSIYRGEVVNGIPEGLGKLTYPDNTEFEGRFKEGIYWL